MPLKSKIIVQCQVLEKHSKCITFPLTLHLQKDAVTSILDLIEMAQHTYLSCKITAFMHSTCAIGYMTPYRMRMR